MDHHQEEDVETSMAIAFSVSALLENGSPSSSSSSSPQQQQQQHAHHRKRQISSIHKPPPNKHLRVLEEGKAELPLAPSIREFLQNPLDYEPRPEWCCAVHTDRRSTNSLDEVPTVCPAFFMPDYDLALQFVIRNHKSSSSSSSNTTLTAALRLLEYGAPINHPNTKGVTPLILAAQKGLTPLVQELLGRGANVAHVTSNGTTAVLQAAHFGHLSCVELLLANNRRFVELANFNHTTPLMRASQEGHLPVVQYLIQLGALVNRKNRQSMTALMLASQRGHSDVCHYLIETGNADLEATTEQQSTSLLLATKRNHFATVQVLVQSGCEVFVTDARGRTARDIALQRHNQPLGELCDPTCQVDMMQRYAQRKRSWAVMRMWTLLQQERATLWQRSHRWCHPSTLCLLRTMTLPAPLVQAILEFAPLPSLWDERVQVLTRRTFVQANAALSGGLDLMDEVLEEGGFLHAMDQAVVPPPYPFSSWTDWKGWGRRNAVIVAVSANAANATPNNEAPAPRRHLAAAVAALRRPNATLTQIPQPQDPNQPLLVELRRHAGYLQLLANHAHVLVPILTSKPYHMPAIVVQQLITSQDICSLIRRIYDTSSGGSTSGVRFDPPMAMDLIMLVSRLCSWYSHERRLAVREEQEEDELNY
jgi:ankyrin repeat protein